MALAKPIEDVLALSRELAAKHLKVCASRDALGVALERLIVGVTKESTPTCDWYDGIEWDAVEESRTALREATA